VLGLLTLTIQYTMSATHTWSGINYADAFNLTMMIVGVSCILFGSVILIAVRMSSPKIDDAILQTGNVPTA